jgi:hypothetical protein
MEFLKAGAAGLAGRARPWSLLILMAALAGVASGFSRTVAASMEQPTHGSGLTLAIAGRANATPTIAAAGRFVAVAWSAALPSGATDIFLAVSRDGGTSFAVPVRVNDKDGDARVNGEQPPRVTLGRAGTAAPEITVVWPTKGASGTRLIYARSDDGGQSFGRTAGVPGADGAGNRGWQAAAADRDGHVDVVWLDHRELAQQDGMVASTHHQHGASADAKPDGVAMAQKSKLYIAAVDRSIAPYSIAGGVCYCCKTALATGADGSLYTAWRHVYPGNLRDIAFALSRDGGRTFGEPVRVSEDSWMLEGCPDDGPAMAVDARNRIHIVWPTLATDAAAEPTIALFYAASSDGRRFTPRERIPTEGMPHHPQMAIAADGTLNVAWDELTHGARRAALAQAGSAAGGVARFTRRIVSDADSAIYPVVATIEAGTLVAWTSKGAGESVIRLARLVQ